MKWNFNGEQREEKLEFSIKGNAYMSSDAYIGKSERRSRAFIFNQVSDIEVSDGDVEDVEVTIVSSTTNQAKPSQENMEQERLKEYLSSKLNKDTVDSLSDEELQSLENFVETLDSYADAKSVQVFAKSKKFSELEQELIKQKFAEFKK